MPPYEPPITITPGIVSLVAETGELAYLPVESLISERQTAYYEALGESDRRADSSPFVEFMLMAVRDTLIPALPSDQVRDQVSDQVISLLRCFESGREMTATALLERMELRHRPNFRKNYLNPALSLGLIEMTDPESPRSPVQRYRLTEQGRRAKH